VVERESGQVAALAWEEPAGVAAVRACGNRGVAPAPVGQVVEAEPVVVAGQVRAGWVVEREQAEAVAQAPGGQVAAGERAVVAGQVQVG
jgi:hypothetical protein